MHLKSKEEIEVIRQNCLLVSKVLALMATLLKPGISGKKLDAEAETLIRDHGAEPGFKGYNGFPSTLCISPNEVVVHGIPNNKTFKEGDIVSIDCGVYWNDYYGDAAYTFLIGEVSDEVVTLCRNTRESLYRGIKKAVAGNKIGDIGYAIQDFTERQCKHSVVRKLVGHGLGRELHEEPQVPNYGRRNSGPRLKEGLVIAIEPMINLGRKNVVQKKDGWTIIAKDYKPSAHYEHTVAIRKGAADILSSHDEVEENIKKNEYLKVI